MTRGGQLKVGVTGAGGFLGRNFIRVMEGAAFEVVRIFGIDDITQKTGDLDCVVNLGESGALSSLEAALDGCDWLIHLAGPASVADSFNKPDLHFRIHTAGTAMVMRAANTAMVRARIYISSAEVYGSAAAKYEKIAEDAVCEPVSPYGAAKLAAEWVAGQVAEWSASRLHVVRPFSSFGSGMREETIIGSVIAQAREDGNIILNDARITRDYIHAADLSEPRLSNRESGHGAESHQCVFWARCIWLGSLRSGSQGIRRTKSRPISRGIKAYIGY